MVSDAVVAVLVDGDEHACAAHLGLSERARYLIDPTTGLLEVR